MKKKSKVAVIVAEVGPSLVGAVKNMKKDDIVPDERAAAMRPMTKEEWEKKQSVIRRVYDPETGRDRLVKGDGEILEEIVSYQRHKEINKQATQGDGLYYAHKMGIHDK